MKKYLLILALAFAGCATTGGGLNPETSALVLRTGTSVAAYEGLKNNPKYVAGTNALIVGLDAALTGNFVINDATIAAFVEHIAAKNHLDPAEGLFLSGIARTAWQVYAHKYHVTSVLISDPQAKLYVQSFRDGLNDALLLLSIPRTG